MRKYPYESSKYVVNAYSSYMFKETYKKEWFVEKVKKNFESCDVYIPKEYNAILSHLYGNYMTPPPDDRKYKHKIVRIEEE